MRVKTILLAVSVLGISCAKPSMPQSPHIPSATTDQDAALIVRAYETLTEKHIVPSSPRRLAEIAIAALPGGVDHAAGFGDDPSANARVLAERARVLLAHATTSAGAREAVWSAIRAMIVAADDPHAMLFEPGEWASLLDLLQDKPAAAPGAAFTLLGDGRLVTLAVDPSGPADRAGLRAGDIVIAIGVRPVVRLADILDLYGHAAGAKLPVRVQRPTAATPVQLTYTSELWRPPVVESRMVTPEVGYVRLHLCTASAPALVRAQLDQLQRSSARAIVFDLRGNPGGLASELISLFSPADPVSIVRDQAGHEDVVPRHGDAWPHPLPTVVLVDGGTFSAAEMIAFSLDDLGAARVVGRPTAGGLTGVDDTELADGYLLHFANMLVVGARSHLAATGHRVTPDTLLPERSPQEIAAGVDRQLDAAIEIARTVARPK